MDTSAKILLIGKTGAGKSSFINYFVGHEVAPAGDGKPCTPGFIPYKIKGGRYPIEIFDTKGLEALHANDQLEKIVDEIKQHNNSDNVFDWFHTIFYCVSMSDPRFQDFEAALIRRLRKELSQHIHIILTHCDACSADQISHMRERIRTAVGLFDGIEIFEVISVHKKKRNGQVVEPCGKEIIVERVFDLLLEDIATRLSRDYARTLHQSLVYLVDETFSDLRKFVENTIKFKTLVDIIKDTDDTFERLLDERMDQVMAQLDERMEDLQRQTDAKFQKILMPVIQLYTSYMHIVTLSGSGYIEGAGLDFNNVIQWMDVDWMDEISEKTLGTMLLPNLAQYMDSSGEFMVDDPSILDIFRIIGAGVVDIFQLKKRILRVLDQMQFYITYRAIPSQETIQKKVCQRIVRHFRPRFMLK